jgi:cell pole-organizing protein PopZ
LATAQTVDFLYTCESHLVDPGFASRIADDPPSKPKLSAEEIAQVKADWEEKQKRKADKAKEEKGKEENKDDSSKDKTTKASSEVASPAPAPTPKQPSHEKYALHRDIFALRTGEHRRRKQTAQAKELAPRLPGAPRNTVN